MTSIKARGRRFAAIAALAAGALMLSNCSAPEEGDSKPAASLTVRVTTPQEDSWPEVLAATGAIKPWQEMVISAETGPYRIARLNVDVGSWVGKGAVLATLSRDTLEAERARLQAAIAEAQATLSKAQSDVRRANLVKDTGALSDQEIEGYRVSEQTARASLEAARAELRANSVSLSQTAVRAPDGGVVSSRSADLGKVVSAGEELFRMVRQGIVEWQAELTAEQLQRAEAGQLATVTLPDGNEVVGTVRLVSPTLDGDTSRGLAYVRLPVSSGAQAGMYANGGIELDARKVMTVPETAVVLRDGKSYVFVIGNKNVVTETEITAGQRRDTRVEISGIGKGTKIVATGASFLSDGATVRVQSDGKQGSSARKAAEKDAE
ncbi:efflux RND transporter periplasmic adaptor subunit [Novosphingobium sp. PC22D]|uniref:efflux RND transporter periplasmic adaptor subunit n=1 Tax=Novosphingobium sp. PC22D TaxID=1962403 RepID=UPI001F0A2B81|nr:efflux RND transporter periplasmic adaptor subunit [Novosphingobium sp. PC22D]